jgi:hypothetical protein
MHVTFEKWWWRTQLIIQGTWPAQIGFDRRAYNKQALRRTWDSDRGYAWWSQLTPPGARHQRHRASAKDKRSPSIPFCTRRLWVVVNRWSDGRDSDGTASSQATARKYVPAFLSRGFQQGIGCSGGDHPLVHMHMSGHLYACKGWDAGSRGQQVGRRNKLHRQSRIDVTRN